MNTYACVWPSVCKVSRDLDSLSKNECKDEVYVCCQLRETYVKTTTTFYENTMQKLNLRL